MFNFLSIMKVIDSFDFSGDNGWLQVRGGMSLLIKAMTQALSLSSNRPDRLRTDAKVTHIGRQKDPANTDSQISVSTHKGQTFRYDHVILTMPLGVLNAVNTSQLDFDVEKRMAIRVLTNEASVKVAIKFKTRFWEDPAKMNGTFKIYKCNKSF